MDLSTKKLEDDEAKGAGTPMEENDKGACSSNAVANNPPQRQSKQGDLFVLSEARKTIIYHGDDMAAATFPKTVDEDDDSFYEVEVTLDDVKTMFRDLQKRREDMENAPFKGRKIRELEKETATLKNLHDHPNTAIRIRFPDRVVLQGMFRTSDTISSVKEWLTEYLNDPALEFYLFTTPPRKVLQNESKLVDEGLVGMAVVYFGSSFMPDNNKVLKPEMYTKLSDPDEAFSLAKNNLKVRMRDSDNDDEEIKPSTETAIKDHSTTNEAEHRPVVRAPVDKGKVPKWFKMK